MARTGDSSSADRPQLADDVPHSNTNASSTPQVPHSGHADPALSAALTHFKDTMKELEETGAADGKLHALTEENIRLQGELRLANAGICQTHDQARENLEQFLQIGYNYIQLQIRHLQLLTTYRRVTSSSQSVPVDGDDDITQGDGDIDGEEQVADLKARLVKLLESLSVVSFAHSAR